MGKNTKIIATVIPIEYRDNNLRVYVHLTPRLPDSGILSDYYEIFNWTDFGELFLLNTHQFVFYLKNNDHFDVQFRKPGTPNRINYLGDYKKHKWNVKTKELTEISSTTSQVTNAKQLWRKMFDPETKVAGWVINELPYDLLEKLTREELNSKMNNAIDETIENILSGKENTGNFPQYSKISLDEQNTLIEVLKSLKELNPENKLHDPILFEPLEGATYDVRPDLIKNLKKHLTEFNQGIENQINDLLLRISLQDIETRNIEETEEFHKKLSSYSTFPFLLKQTGWLWEYSISIDLPKNTYFVKFELTFPDESLLTTEQKLFIQEIDFKSPFSAIEVINKDTVTYGSKQRAIKEPNEYRNYLILKNGYIKTINLPSEKYPFEVAAELIEKNQLFDKIKEFINREYNLQFTPSEPINSPSNIAKQQQVVDALNVQQRDRFTVMSTEYKQLESEKNLSSGKPDFVSSGISLKIKDLKTAVKTTLTENPSTQSVTQQADRADSAAVVYDHNIHMGYRVDVYDRTRTSKTNEFSLCKRDVYFGFYDEELAQCIYLKDTDEGWLSESVQGSNSGRLYVDTELLRWNDWSLVASRLFKSMESDEKNIEFAEEWINEDEPLQICAFPAKNSLPPLRFGHQYQFSLRFVDICGGGPESVPLDSTDNKEFLTVERPYLRTDPISAPLIHLFDYLHKDGDRTKPWIDKYWGEDLLTIVIRSRIENKELKVERNASSSRVISPPEVKFHFVKKHGVLDKIIHEQNRSAFVTDTAKELIDLSSYTLENDNEKKNEELRDIEEIDYLFDPLINGYELVIDRIVEEWKLKNTLNLDVSTQNSGYWEGIKYFKLNLEHKNNVADFENKSISPMEKTIYLQQGVEKELIIKCTNYNTIRTFLKNDASMQVDNLFFKNTITTNKSYLRLIHAVQKPCLILNGESGNFQEDYSGDFSVQERDFRQSQSKLNIIFPKFPDLTTESYILYVWYVDIVSDRNCTKGYYFNEINQIISSGFYPINGRENNIEFSNLQHTLSDTKHRCVFYYLEATSKFKKYFPPSVTDFSVFGYKDGALFNSYNKPWIKTNKSNPDNLECNSTLLPKYNDDGWIKILSSNNPDPVVIKRIVPLIRWEGDMPNSVERICDTIRIYFEGDWFSSGECEQVALLFMKEKEGKNYDYSSANVNLELENYISQFGNDPTSQKQFFEQTNDILRIDETSVYGELLPNAIDLKSLDFDNKDKSTLDGYLVHALAFNIQYAPPDKKTGEMLGSFYIDVQLKDKERLKNLYFPFVRFAVARYQPNSISDTTDGMNVHFSKIVVTDFVQLLPYRSIQLSDGLLTYNAPSIRRNEGGSSTNIIRIVEPKSNVFDENIIDIGSEEELLTELYNKEGKLTELNIDQNITERGLALNKTELAFTGSNFIIEEYEQYETSESKFYKPVDQHGRRDYTKRLILAYKYTK